MTNGQNLARSRHLEELAQAAKRYTLQEILDVTNAVASELGNLGGASYADFTGATSIAGGLSGLVPAPQAGDNDKFLRGDGSWATVSSGGSSAVVSSGNILSTVASTVDGGLWYELANDRPILKLRKGNYEYKFNYDTTSYVGGTSNRVAYLPFDTSPTIDVCGNEWTATGSPTIQADANAFGGNSLYLNGSSYLTNNTISASIGSSPWTIDFWATIYKNTGYDPFFVTYNALNLNDTNQWICVNWNSGNPMLNFYGNDPVCSLGLSLNTRYHYALTYDGSDVRLFVDGVLAKTLPVSVQLGGDFFIGTRFKMDHCSGTIDHFRIFGSCLWTDDFTPPTASDYD